MRFISCVSLFFSSCVSKVSALLISPQTAVSRVQPALTEHHLKAAKLCRDVYCENIETCDTFVESADTGAQVTVSLDGVKAIVCFRGSDSIEDWRSNFKLAKVPFLSRKHKNANLEVHSGFFIGHNSVKSKIYAKLNTIIEAGKCESVLFVGHSAGATLAAISAFDFQNDKKLDVEVVTFGSPKIGNAAFASDFDSKMKCTRIVNDNDGIALVPMFSGYHHVGDAIHLRNVAPAPTQCLKAIWHAIVNFARLDSIADHDMDSYVTTIEHSLKKQE